MFCPEREIPFRAAEQGLVFRLCGNSLRVGALLKDAGGATEKASVLETGLSMIVARVKVQTVLREGK